MSTTSTEGSPSPAALNAPRYGTVVPKRIFVGGISANTTEAELHELFSHYGVVTNTKIISDRAGVSKGYGFVTFDTEEEAQRAQLSASNLMLRDRRLNVAPAIKKQPFARVYDPTQSVPNGTVLYHNGIPYTYHNGMAFFITPEAMYQYAGQASSAATAAAPPAYPVIYQPSVYYPQQPYQYQNVVPPQWTTGGSPWRWTPSQNPSGQAPPGAYGYAAPVASGASAHLGSGGGPDSPEYRDPAIVEASAEVGVLGVLPKDDGGTMVTTAAGLSSLWAKASSSGAPGTPAAGRECSTPNGAPTKRGTSPLLSSRLCQRGDLSQDFQLQLSQRAQRPVRRQRRYTAPPESPGSFFQTASPSQCDGAEGGERGSGVGLPQTGELGPSSSKWDGGRGWRECMFDVPPSTPCQSQHSVCP